MKKTFNPLDLKGRWLYAFKGLDGRYITFTDVSKDFGKCDIFPEYLSKSLANRCIKLNENLS
jgi:hypothetical protein